MKKQISITIDIDLLNRVDAAAKNLNLNRSQMINNLLEVAMMDYESLKKMGLINIAKFIRSLTKKGFSPVDSLVVE